MISVFFSRVVILTAGTLYPAYRSYKAVRTKDVREYVKWMMYWIVFALFCFGETIADILVSFWFPFYYELKILFVLWLLSPWTKGASILYRKWVHPLFMKHEEEIDGFLEQAKSETYNQVVNLGSRGLLCARDIVATAALRGQVHLVEQLQRSYSTGDVNRESVARGVGAAFPSTKRVKRIEEEQEEGESGEGHIEDEIRMRAWSGEYDEHGRIVEEVVMAQIVDEEMVLIEDPNQHSVHSRSTSSPGRAAVQPRRPRSRNTNTLSGGPNDPSTHASIDSHYDSNTLPRRSSRKAAAAAAAAMAATLRGERPNDGDDEESS